MTKTYIDISTEHWVVPEEQAGERLDHVLTSMQSVQSRARARRALETGKVTLDNVIMGPKHGNTLLSAGQRIVIEWTRPQTTVAHSKASSHITSQDLDILYEDAHLIAVNKPPGMLSDTATHAQRKERNSVFYHVSHYLRPQGRRPAMAHRIDRDTSGVVLLAKTTEARDKLKDLFIARKVERTYWAALQTTPATEGLWTDWVLWDEQKLVLRTAHPNERAGKEATSYISVTETFPGGECTINVRLVTGRRNQIRYQCQQRNAPLIGERLYLPPDWRRNEELGQRQALHAIELRLLHPITGQVILVEAPLPDDLVTLTNRLRNARPNS
ncbi:MAG: RluA family pseudouridine synthase [Myxococcales bacterium]|nr:RluA family pseudouridine synthase [Myxococcales bacterium]